MSEIKPVDTDEVEKLKSLSLDDTKTQTVTPESFSKKQRKKKKGAMNPADLTPEYIAEQRAKKLAAKKLASKEVEDVPLDLQFIKREFLTIPNQDHKGDDLFKIDIMTYNLLAQALIRRKLFPTSGDALKWSKRSIVLLNEIKFYNSDILCFQEVDYIQFNSFWKIEMSKLGYDSKYYRDGDKNHGICIFWKSEKFQCIDVAHISYDKEDMGDINLPTITRNVALVVCLRFTDKVLQKYPNASKQGCFIGTTHMFWHPFGTLARTLQTYILLKSYQEFCHRVNVLNKTESSNWFEFLAGDFNSQPYDSPYLSITRKPVYYDGRAEKVLAVSSSFQYSQLRGTGVAEEKSENIELIGLDQPESPLPLDDFRVSDEQKLIILDILALHNSLTMRAISLYSVGYHEVHPENTDNDRNEPIFSNWAHAWRGLLDYIFVLRQWNRDEDCRLVDSLTNLEKENGVLLLALLRMPMPLEMGEEPSGQPRAGMYGSDHLCMIARVGLKL